jgi:hypothetical protein
MPAPHPTFKYIRPDEVAECWDGVPDNLYRALWQVMRFLPKYDGETPPEPDLLCLAKVWDYLSDAEQEGLNALAVAEEEADAALNPYIPDDDRS